MASSYPSGLDVGFPGWPYEDFLEYVTAEQANSWIAAIQAIETTVGYGTGTASPLYSAAYSKAFSTISARIANVEATAVSGLQLNTSAANIQPIGVTASAGSTGKAADAGHVHVGVPAAGLVPIGSIILWPAGATTYPSNYAACNGQQLSQAVYSTLYNIIGTTYGSGAGTFGLPNFNDRFPVGAGGTIAPIPGNTGGSTTIPLPVHGHGLTDNGHAHVGYVYEAGPQYQYVYTTGVGGQSYAIPLTGNAGGGALQISYSATDHIQIATTGLAVQNSGTSSSYTPPYLGVIFLMRVQ